MNQDKVINPCNRGCGFDEEYNCTGCHRTLEELRIWRKLSTEEKESLMKQLDVRRQEKNKC